MKKNNKLNLLTPIASALLLVACGGGGSSSEPEVNTITPAPETPNVAPALTIENLQAIESQMVSLKSNATDDNTGLSYAWSVPTVAGLELIETSTDTLSFKAPAVSQDNLDINVSLTVTDSGGLSATKSAIITINNNVPVVSISGIESTLEKETITLDFEIAGANELASYDWSFEGVNVNAPDQSISAKNIQALSVGIGGIGGSINIDVLNTVKPTNLLATLTATDMDGDVSTYTKTILVNNVFEEITLTGLVTDAPIANAAVTVFIGSREITVQADSNGQYIAYIEVDDDEMTSMVKIVGTGVGEQEGAELVSLIGSASALIESSGSGTQLSSDDNFSLNVTNITTAEYALIVDANEGVEPTTSENLNSLSSDIDQSAVFNLAILIKVAIDDPEISLPEGVESTLELVTNDESLKVFEQEVPKTSEAYTDAFDAIISDPTLIAFEAIELPSILYTVELSKGNELSRGIAWKFDNETKTGTWSNLAFNYSINGNVVIGEFINVEVSEDYDERIINGQTEYLYYEGIQKNFEVTLLNNNDGVISYTSKITTDKVYSDSDVASFGITKEVTVSTAEHKTAYANERIIDFPSLIGKTALLPMADYTSTDPVKDIRIMMNDGEFEFFSNGTGKLQHLDIDFIWSLTERNLTINYTDNVNGDVNSTYTLFEEGLMDKVYHTHTVSQGENLNVDVSMVSGAHIKETANKITWMENDIAGIYMSPYNDPKFPANFFWFELKENGDADTISTNDNNGDGIITSDEASFMYGTWIVEDGLIKITRVRSHLTGEYNSDIRVADGGEFRRYHYRTWELVSQGNDRSVILNTHNFEWGQFYQDEGTPLTASDKYLDFRVIDKLATRPVEIQEEMASKALGSKKSSIISKNQHRDEVNLN